MRSCACNKLLYVRKTEDAYTVEIHQMLPSSKFEAYIYIYIYMRERERERECKHCQHFSLLLTFKKEALLLKPGDDVPNLQ
jgi:hypothetical protein